MTSDNNVDVVETSHGAFVGGRRDGSRVLPDLNSKVDQGDQNRHGTNQLTNCRYGFPVHAICSRPPNVKGSVAGRPREQTSSRQHILLAGVAGQLQPMVRPRE